MPQPKSGEMRAAPPGQEPGAPPATSARRRHGPTASPGRGTRRQRQLFRVCTAARSSQASQSAGRFQGRPGAVQEKAQRLNLKSEVRKTSCLSPLCDL